MTDWMGGGRQGAHSLWCRCLVAMRVGRGHAGMPPGKQKEKQEERQEEAQAVRDRLPKPEVAIQGVSS